MHKKDKDDYFLGDGGAGIAPEAGFGGTGIAIGACLAGVAGFVAVGDVDTNGLLKPPSPAENTGEAQNKRNADNINFIENCILARD